ncbi:hypothetical protein VTO73DRAFT_1963 [Trametes versicolor]
MSSPSTYDWAQAFLELPAQTTPAAASPEKDYPAEDWHLQDQGHPDTHSSGPSYSLPSSSQAYQVQEDEVARDFRAPFGYQQEWTDGATTGVDPSQVLWAGRPSAPSSSSAGPPLVNPSVAPSALVQSPRPQILAPAPVHSRLDFFLQPASFTPAPHAPSFPRHLSSSTPGEPQDDPRGYRKRARDDKENETNYTSRLAKRVWYGEEQQDHDVPAATIPQPMMASSMSYRTAPSSPESSVVQPQRQPREWPCPMLSLIDEDPGLCPDDGTKPAELCSRGTKPFTRPCDSRRHFESEHLGVRYRMLRGPHRGCGEFSRRDAILRHVRDCRKFPGALRVQGWLGVFMPCWRASALHRACGVEYRRKLERDLGGSGVLVYKCECCRVLGGEELGGAGARGAREIEGAPVKIKEEEAGTNGLLCLAGSQTNSEAAYESEEDSPCAMATTGGEPQITQAQTSDEDDGNIPLFNDPWVGFWVEDNDAGTDSDTSVSEHISDIGGCAVVASKGILSPSAPAHDVANDWQNLADLGPVQLEDTSTNALDSLFSDEGEGDDADADGSDSETDAGLQALHPSVLLVKAQSGAREDSPAVPLRLAATTTAAAADSSSGQSEPTSNDSPEDFTPADGRSQ